MYGSDNTKGTVNYDIWQIFGILISNKMCTLRELKEHYTYYDAVDMLDIVLTDNYNARILQLNNAPKGT